MEKQEFVVVIPEWLREEINRLLRLKKLLDKEVL